jgi:Tfp pilus assembly protein PilF
MPNARMYLYCTILARTVPILFLASAILVGLRLIHDRIRSRYRMAGSVLMIAFTIVALALTFSTIARTSTLIGAELAHERREHELASQRFEMAERLGGRLGYRENFEMGESLLYSGNPADAVERLEKARHDPSGVFSLAAQHTLARAYFDLHQPDRVRPLLLSTPAQYPAAAERDYMLARISEREDPSQAAALFARSIANDETFFPSVYHLARLKIAAGDVASARTLLDRFFRAHPNYASAEFRRAIMHAVENGEPLYDNEFL